MSANNRVVLTAFSLSTFFILQPAYAQSEMADVRASRFAQRDRNRDGFLSLAEYGGHQGNFRALDRNGDQRLDRDEFVRRNRPADTAPLPDAFADLDYDGNGFLNRSEWDGESVAFDRVDRNDDGRIGPEEFRNPPEADDRQQRFSGRDQNGDGVLSRIEWRDEAVAFHRADRNDDGVVTLREYLNLPQGGPAGQGEDREARFDVLDRNNDGVLVRSEWRESTVPFEQADRNRNGAVTLWEFVNLPPAAAVDLTFEDMDHNNDGVLSRREWHAEAGAFARADLNGDGVVTVREFVGSSAQDPSARFRALDRNRDGFLSGREWTGSRDSFSRMDRNRDGRLSRVEYLS